MPFIKLNKTKNVKRWFETEAVYIRVRLIKIKLIDWSRNFWFCIELLKCNKKLPSSTINNRKYSYMHNSECDINFNLTPFFINLTPFLMTFLFKTRFQFNFNKITSKWCNKWKSDYTIDKPFPNIRTDTKQCGLVILTKCTLSTLYKFQLAYLTYVCMHTLLPTHTCRESNK